MQRIVVLNPKGGSGKTTIAINLASYFASRGHSPVVMDYDPQGSSLRWVRKRKPSQAPIQAIAAYEKADSRTTRTFQLRLPESATHVIVDTPAALEPSLLPEMTRAADKIIVPVLPSDIDIHTCSRCIRDLLLVAKIRREEDRIGVIANRIRRNTLAYQALIRFLHTLGIPIVATIRDSQNYLRAAELGIGVHEMKAYVAKEDVEQWTPLVAWLAAPRGTWSAAVAGGAAANPAATAPQSPVTPVAATLPAPGVVPAPAVPAASGAGAVAEPAAVAPATPPASSADETRSESAAPPALASA
jgi:chromosome partitioning protein